jgi:glutamyl-tRNA synthetase
VKKVLQKAQLWDDAYENNQKEWFLSTIDLIRSRFHVLTDFAGAGRAYFSDEYEMDPKPVKKNLTKHEKIGEWLGFLAERYESLPDFDKDDVEKVTRELADELDIKPGILINGTRTVVTGQAAGAGIFDVLMAIGRDRVIARLKKFSSKS